MWAAEHERRKVKLRTWVNSHALNESVFTRRFPPNDPKALKRGATSTFFASGQVAVRKSVETNDFDTLYRVMNETMIMETPSPYVVRLLDTFVVRPRPKIFYVAHILELADFGSLDTHIPTRGMSANAALACMQQIFSGLAFLHSSGIVHYDIKPENVLVFRNGRLKLTDFDISLRVGDQVVDNSDDVQERYQIAGSVEYMAPEVARVFQWIAEMEETLQKMEQKAQERDEEPQKEKKDEEAQEEKKDEQEEQKISDEYNIDIRNIYNVDIFSAGMTFLQLLTNMWDTPEYRIKPVVSNITSEEELESSLKLVKQRLQQSYKDRVEKNWSIEALRVEKKLRGNACKRCKSLFRYTLQSDPSSRKSAAWIVNRMTKWTWRPGRFGFDDAKSKSIVAQMVQRRGGGARGGARGESKVQLRL